MCIISTYMSIKQKHAYTKKQAGTQLVSYSCSTSSAQGHNCCATRAEKSRAAALETVGDQALHLLASSTRLCIFFFFFLIYTESYSEVIPIARANIKGHLKEKKIKKKQNKKTIIIIIATKQRNKLNRSKIVYDLSLKV